ncbi:hypothetical protein TMatcc_006344 [Talaromyces marneffei ATCC 18224]|uniref:Phenol monooxygenase, putative n=1 Tax=Talaromyces marneffei (strain ATCC 18224 / CBS 334.59 / QM 7333) TaxID=441960 RepID=B6QBF6_TALMQ|nr:phenol monooxygenase, putative [Talaromyces marneffei ATCC 18224]KAE8554157.1 hypothetical protein EYB25_002695 [Talaromyces marneffei]
MPVFQETAHASRDLRVRRSRARPLPRLSAQPEISGNNEQGNDEKYEVVVIGAGPAGLFLTLLLARYGLSDSLACFDKKPGTLKAGQADGLQPRTLEVFSTLGLHHEILDEGCHMSEVAFWNPGTTQKGIERTAFVPDVVVPARYKHEVTIHQGRIERILEEDFQAYSPDRSIFRSTEFVDFTLDPSTDPEFPVRIEIDVLGDEGSSAQRKVVRAKHIIGADGAHSKVRRSMGLQLHGDTTDHIWGVVDFVIDTNFPDIRKRCAIHSDTGSVMVIPRERIASGHYLTRLYVQIKDEIPAEADGETLDEKAKSSKRRAAITLESILEQGKRVFAPYKIAIKPGTEVDWWAAYQIGQRMTHQSTLKDESGMERVFLVGDACHTHSPKAGQGMNVSMMDSYNLAWKLAHTIHGLSPKPQSSTNNSEQDTPTSVLNTFQHERLTVARQLIEFDSKFSSMFSGQIGAEESVEGLTHEEFLKVFSDGSGFTSGCGVEYAPSIIVDQSSEPESMAHVDSTKSVNGDAYLSGVLRPGRRLLDTVVRRYADANPRHLHDEFLSTGRYRILVFATHDLVDRQKETTNHSGQSLSAQALETICRDIIPAYPKDTIELVVLHPFHTRDFEWDQMPDCLKEFAEMSFHGPMGPDALHEIYGVNEDIGAVVAVRPDGYVGAVKSLTDARSLGAYFDNCLVRVDA